MSNITSEQVRQVLDKIIDLSLDFQEKYHRNKILNSSQIASHFTQIFNFRSLIDEKIWQEIKSNVECLQNVKQEI